MEVIMVILEAIVNGVVKLYYVMILCYQFYLFRIEIFSLLKHFMYLCSILVFSRISVQTSLPSGGR